MKFNQNMDMDDPNVDLEGQGQRARSPGQKLDFRSYLTTLQAIFEVKGHMGQGQRLTLKVKDKVTKSKMWFQVPFNRLTGNVQGQGSKVTWVKVKGQVG